VVRTLPSVKGGTRPPSAFVWHRGRRARSTRIARLFFRRWCWLRRSGCRRRSLLDPEGPVCLDLLSLRLRADDYGTGFVAQLLRNLIRHGTRFGIVVGRNNTEAAHPHLHTAGFDLPDATEVGFYEGKPGAHCFAVCGLSREILRADFGYRCCAPG